MKNEPLNVLSSAYREKLSPVDEVAQMLTAPGVSKTERKQILRALNKTTRLTEKAQKRLDQSAYEKYRDITDLDFVHFNAILGLVLYEDYHWKEDENQEHGQITSMMERIQKKMRKYQKLGYSTHDIVKELDDKTGILLVPDKDYTE